MKILLINPPMCIDMPPRFISFGIAYIAQELKRNHYDVEILDIDANRFSEEEVSSVIRGKAPDVIGIGGLVTVYPYLHWLIPEIRKIKPGVKIILGGAIASSLKQKCFERFDIDYEVIAEGEVTIIELLKELKGNGNFVSVKGIGFRDNGKVIFTERRPLMDSLESVPIIDYSPFPLEKLLKSSEGVLQIHAQRGCPGKCTFCFNCYRVVSGRVRYRPVTNVVDEIEYFRNKYEVGLFALSGECVMLNKRWIIDFCKELLKRGLDIKYRVTSRVNTLDEERLQWLKKSGCTVMSLGLETGSEKIINIMKKGVTVEQGRKAVMLAKKYISRIDASIMLGYIGEDEDTLRETVRFAKEIGVKPALFYATPFPGTELYEMALANGSIKDEEEYMMNLNKSSIFSLSINLTDMPDDKMQALLDSAVKEINRYYLYKDLINPNSYKRAFLYLVKNGFGNTAVKVMELFGMRK